MRLVMMMFAIGVAAVAAEVRTTVLVVNVSPACAISVVSSRVSSDGVNNVSSGEILFRYSIRTSRSGGGGSIKLLALDSGRPVSISTQLSGAAAGVPLAQTLTSGESLVVARFGTNAHSSDAGESGVISWTAAGASPPEFSLSVDCQ
jgi:hypothetical protein